MSHGLGPPPDGGRQLGPSQKGQACAAATNINETTARWMIAMLAESLDGYFN